jgi:cytochrome c oxidase subunit II
MTKVLNVLLLSGFIAVILVASYWIGQQAYSWLPHQATAEAKQVDSLFSFLTSIGAFIFLGIAGIIFYSLLFYRAPKTDWSHGHPARSNAALEITWLVVPVLLVLWLASQNFKIYQQINIQGLTPIVHLHLPEMSEPAAAATLESDAKSSQNGNAKPAEEAIEVVAKQWYWSFRYPDQVTSTDLHLPVNQSTRLLLKSEDVLHGFYVPEFRIKQDIIPNRTITFVLTPIREGKYRLRDSQFSGTYFSLMEANVYVESPEQYRQWLSQAAAHKPAPAENLPFQEYTQQNTKVLGLGWPTVSPAQPPVVNR